MKKQSSLKLLVVSAALGWLATRPVDYRGISVYQFPPLSPLQMSNTFDCAQMVAGFLAVSLGAIGVYRAYQNIADNRSRIEP